MTDDSIGAGGAIHRSSGEKRHDVTQTFGHDSDLSFVPFGADLTEPEAAAISALPSGSALLLVRAVLGQHQQLDLAGARADQLRRLRGNQRRRCRHPDGQGKPCQQQAGKSAKAAQGVHGARL